VNRTLSNAALVLALCFGLSERSSAQSGEIYGFSIDTVAGNYQFGNGVAATQALLSFPSKLAIDSTGAVYIADTTNNLIRKVVAGQITTFAGTGIPGFSGDGQAATSAQLNSPSGVAVDGAGNVYIYDTRNDVIRKVGATGSITTFAGTPGKSGSAGDGGPATQALLNLNLGGNVALDSAGNVYFSDYYNSVVRKVAVSTNIISSFAGMNGKTGSGGDGGPATSANLQTPAGLAFDSGGNLYIADVNSSVIRMVSATTGNISTVAGASGQFGSGGDGGPAELATLSGPNDVAADAAGNLYIADTGNSKVRMVSAGAALITTLAGTGAFGFGGDGGAATAALLTYVNGVGVDKSGNVYIADTDNNRIRMVHGGTIGEFAGADHAQGDGSKATAALLYFPQGIAWDNKADLYIADTRNNKIRKVTPDGNISTIAGTGSYIVSGDGGPALAAGLDQPQAVAVDGAGNVYIATGNQVRMVDSSGNINTVVNSTGAAGFTGDGASAADAELSNPLGLAVDSANNLYIADTNNHRIRKVSGGNISTIVGAGPSYPSSNGSFGGDGGPASLANLSFPYDVAFDGSGNMFIADTVNNRIRRVDGKSGNISTLAGSAAAGGYSGDLGPATSALLNAPIGVAADSAGNIFFTDGNNNVVRVVDGFGTISTIAGNHTLGFSGDGGSAITAELDFPWGIATNASGNVWVVDANNHRVRELTPTSPLVSSGSLGVVNAASFASGGLVPGGMATLFGSNLTSAKGINLASAVPLGAQLLNTSVKIDNTLSAPIFAVDNVNGQQQINFQAPWELAGKSSAVLQVANNGALSLPVTVPVLAAQPGVFTYTVGSDTFGVVLHVNFQLANTADPVASGEFVLIFCTNLGAVAPAIADGVAGSGAQTTVAPVTVTIGGASAPVSFSGLAAGFVGLYQVNAQVPTGLAAMNQPLVVRVSGASSVPVLLPVK
jgi:uncharacterized protein (TIGR03437 family)